jgi:hypothetical protein
MEATKPMEAIRCPETWVKNYTWKRRPMLIDWD